MAASAATTLSLAQRPVIDLTQSDDEDGPRPQLPRKRTSAAVTLSWDLPASHNGLPMAITLDSTLGQSSRRGSNSSSSAVRSHTADRTRILSNFGQRPPQQLPINRNNVSSNRKSARIPSPVAEISVADITYGANTSKRRKTNGATIPNDNLSSKLSSSGVRIQGRVGRISDNVERPASVFVAISTADTPTPDHHSARHPTTSRNSQHGRIQKPKQRSHRDVRYLASERNERMVQVLRNQVFKHIKARIKDYETVLSSKDRTNIGTQTAEKLVEDPSFAENFMANDWQLSPDYEKKLAIKARSYVDKRVREIQDETYLGSSKSAKGISKDKNAHPEVTSLASHFVGSSDSRMKNETTPSVNGFHPSHQESEVQHFKSLGKVFETSSSHDDSLPWADNLTSPSAIAGHKSHGSRSSKRPTRSSVHQLYTTDSAESLQHSLEDQQASTQLNSQALSVGNTKRSRRSQTEEHGGEFQRPYISQIDMDSIAQTTKSAHVSKSYLRSRLGLDPEAEGGYVVHVGFCSEELEYVCRLVTKFLSGKRLASGNPKERLMFIMAGQEAIVPQLVDLLEQELTKSGTALGQILLRTRGSAALSAFLLDAAQGSIAINSKLIRLQVKQEQKPALSKASISSLLRERETSGMTPSRVRRGLNPFRTKVSSALEDSFVRQHEWIDCCGDISAVTWTSGNAFICGATAHSDHHNMQYNKPGNLLVGSTTQGTLKAFANHRVPRPASHNASTGTNALDSMYQTQEPWLYTSVVATSHSHVNGYTFTASFDQTVKVWTVARDGSSMDLEGTWMHDGQVNFVVTSEHHERVATASDVSANAIRVYNFDENDINGTPFDTYCGEKAREQALEFRRRDTWAYFPATIQWGRAEAVKDFLLVGYSPRSVTGYEVDIPEEKKNSGELCLWNVNDGSRINISSAKSQNVFEVIWHPTQPCFLVATSPCGVFELETRTQIRLFAQNEFGTFIHIKAMDCPASDINELTMMPNSNVQCYVTASCTDGNTYVWDTAQGDKPIHVLSHGDSLDNPLHDMPLELADTGIKFASWGSTIDRFYTGGSDGKVKAWNIRAARGRAFVRNILEVTGGISAGAFSKDFLRLLIGDATGKVHLVGVDDSDLEESATAEPSELFGDISPDNHIVRQLPAKRPKVIIPHPEPSPPENFEMRTEEADQTGQEVARAFLDAKQLMLHPNREIGVIQGPFYHETRLYRREAHQDSDGTQPLLPQWQGYQQFERDASIKDVELPCLPNVRSSAPEQHKGNMSLDFDFERLSISCQQALIRDRVELDWDDDDFEYEIVAQDAFCL